MSDYLPPIRINVRDPRRQFLERAAELAQATGTLLVEKHYDSLGQDAFDVVNLRVREPTNHVGVGGQLIAYPDGKSSISVEIRAERWRPVDPPTYEIYCAEARALIVPLLRAYNRKFNTCYRLSIPKKKKLGPVLPPKCAKLFNRFAALANKPSLHPLDWRRFYEFVRDCRSRKTLSKDQFALLLTESGFPDDYAQHIASVYAHLREFKRIT